MQEHLLILASGSPRRKELLGSLGLTFDILVSEADESFAPGQPPVEIVQELAYRKASAVANTLNAGLVLGADTIVVCDDVILGKPEDEGDAKRILRLLSGRSHTVYTGIALVEAGGEHRVVRDVRGTTVVMKALTDEQIDAYVATGEPMDKAGAYGIQGKASQFITRIDGDYFNVVGLPVSLVADHLATFGCNVLPR
ncbi:Maf family protein [Tumebacillus permanentifrigoris]|uniref:dTTP/UTP pyrophosphatase n=1 Tax=Tumebacillus permanentifrigoris TaxID=378543 RepID=A0A316D401_9BACL|nr:Maf family protein [Tumebacillus permanentifrigoris]PWK06261.1 septum formation protein [Tumebacillus permanentifrigoris]